MTSSNNPAPWFEALIAKCLASLYLLNLEGCPAADQVGNTAKLWVRLLWEKPRSGWHEELDTPRIRTAFATIANGHKRWPSPSVFWEHLPERPAPDPNRVIGPGWGREREAEALRCRAAWLKSLGVNEWGEPLEPGA